MYALCIHCPEVFSADQHLSAGLQLPLLHIMAAQSSQGRHMKTCRLACPLLAGADQGTRDHSLLSAILSIANPA